MTVRRNHPSAPPSAPQRCGRRRQVLAYLILLVVLPVAVLSGFGAFLAGAYGLGQALAGNPVGRFFSGWLPFFGILGGVLTGFAVLRGARYLGRWRVLHVQRHGTALTGHVSSVDRGVQINPRGSNRAYCDVRVTFTDVDGVVRVLRLRYAWWAHSDRPRTIEQIRRMRASKTPVAVYRSRMGGYGTDLPTDGLSLCFYW